MADRRGTTRPGNSYQDPAYDAIEQRMEVKHKLPKGIMRAIRTRGERSNADQVSEAGARTVYQVIPQTRAAFLKKYGVDAYASPEAAAEVAALHLKESYQRGGDWNAAVGEYHGGTDRRNWGAKTRAYVGRAGKGGLTVLAGENGATALAPGISADGLTAEDFLTMSPGDLGSRRPLGPERKDPRLSTEGKRRSRLDALTGGKGVATGPAPDLTADLTVEREQQAADVSLQQRKDSVSVLDQMYATVDSFLANQMVSALNEEVHEADPGFADFYMKHWQTIEEFADNADEVAQLRGATSVADLQAIQERIGHQRGMDFLLDSGDSGAAWRLGGGLADPAGWLAGLGTGKLFEVAGIGSRALMAQGKTAKAVGSLASEGALGNLAFTAGLDLAGRDQDAGDYLLSGASGLAIGAALSPLALRRARVRDANVTDPLNPADAIPEMAPVFHGSRVQGIQAFDNAKLGTGEGNAAFGAGTYLTESPRIGQWYWEMLTEAAPDGAKAKPVDEALFETLGLDAIANDIGVPAAEMQTALREVMAEARGTPWERFKAWLMGLVTKAREAVAKSFNPSADQLLELRGLQTKAAVAERLVAKMSDGGRGGAVYEARIPNGNYLLWDRPLAEQPEVLGALRDLGFKGQDSVTGAQAWAEMTGGTLQPNASVAGGKGAVELGANLRQRGVLGNKYLTGYARSGKAYNQFNYVLFEGSDAKITSEWRPNAEGGAWTPRAKPDSDPLVSMITRLRTAEAAEQASIAAEAESNLGPEATPEQVRAEEQRIQTERTRNLWKDSLADVPDNLRLLADDPEVMLTADPATAQRVVDENGLDAVSDDAERAMVAELLARSNRILEANPIDEKALQTSLRYVGLESTGNTLLRSKSPVARAVGLTLLESSTGAGGRRSTAALAQAARERVYNRHMVEYDSLYHQFRKGEGVGLVSDAWNGDARRRFNDRVFAEVEARADTPNGWTRDTNPAVVKAADLFERGMNAMRVEQQHVGTVGFARLGSTSRGYMPHRLDPRGVLALTKEQRARLTDILTEQFVDPANGFDRDFSRKLATKYLERARDAAAGSYEVPFNLHSSDAADMVRDSLEALRESAKLSEADIDKMVGKFARGGAGHTKRRLKLDLDADIGDGAKLRDIFVTDVPSLFRGYARRVSGEVALAQFGIMGKKGLNVLRKAIQETGGDPAADLRAFDQIAAEFLNTPYGDANYTWLDNTRIATSLARLGGMGITQFAEFGNGIAAVGAARVFSAIGGMGRLSKEVTHLAKGGESANPILASIDTMGGDLGMDDYQLTRLFDVRDNDIQLYGSERLGVFTRAVRAGGNLQASASFHRRIAAIQTRGMAEQIVRKAVTMVRHGGDDIALDDMGINAEMRAALAKDLDQIATFGGGKLQSLDLRKSTMDPYMLREFRDAIERGSAHIIQRTYKGETGKWAHNGFLKLLLQFRTFSVVSMEKQWGRNVKSRGAAGAFLALMGAMSFAAPIHMARMQAKMVGMSRSEREKFADRNLTPLAVGRATLNYASAAGLLGDVLDLGGGFAVDFGLMDPDEVPFMGARGQGRGSLIGGTVAPGVGLLEDVWDGVHGNGKKLAKALPGANLPYVSPLITGLTSD